MFSRSCESVQKKIFIYTYMAQKNIFISLFKWRSHKPARVTRVSISITFRMRVKCVLLFFVNLWDNLAIFCHICRASRTFYLLLLFHFVLWLCLREFRNCTEMYMNHTVKCWRHTVLFWSKCALNSFSFSKTVVVCLHAHMLYYSKSPGGNIKFLERWKLLSLIPYICHDIMFERHV